MFGGISPFGGYRLSASVSPSSTTFDDFPSVSLFGIKVFDVSSGLGSWSSCTWGAPLSAVLRFSLQLHEFPLTAVKGCLQVRRDSFDFSFKHCLFKEAFFFSFFRTHSW